MDARGKILSNMFCYHIQFICCVVIDFLFIDVIHDNSLTNQNYSLSMMLSPTTRWCSCSGLCTTMDHSCGVSHKGSVLSERNLNWIVSILFILYLDPYGLK